MAYLLGWKDILRPIRDGYRHLFPTPDTGPTPEERQRQRQLDRLKGFTYFDTFEQLETWTEADADPVQRANTPTLIRSLIARNSLGQANVLLCHDYAGNYHDYEGVSGIGMKEEMYTCEFLQYVDTFIYFSHKLVCVPPPTWVNALHRNGTKALGTILIEPQTPDSERLLQRGENGLSFPLATKLAEIADHYGFDGWLLNIEKSFPTANWNSSVMEAFLRQLKFGLGPKKQLIWYDALTASNKISYQNALNASNVQFAKACGGILTNYCWKESGAAASVQEALEKDVPLQQVYLGIDVWAQNTTKLSHPRVTYPEYGGGGTNTGVAIAKLAEMGLSAGVFAPAWSFEHFPGHGRDIERTTWEGTPLPDDVACSCGDCRKRHQPNVAKPVIKYARQFNAGSDAFFYTDFSRAFGTHRDQEQKALFDGVAIHSQLGSQSLLPLPADTENPLRHRLESSADQAQLVVEARDPSLLMGDVLASHGPQNLPLFKLDMPADGSLQLQISFRTFAKHGISFYIKVSGIRHLFSTRQTRNTDLLDTVISVPSPSMPNPRLEELGVHVDSIKAEVSTPKLVEVDFICIQPFLSKKSLQNHKIFDVHASSQGAGEMQHLRLHWSHTSDDQPAQGVPYSAITGPFSYFELVVDGLRLGRSYAAEHVLPDRLVKGTVGRKALVEITGVGFDGRVLASAGTVLQF